MHPTISMQIPVTKKPVVQEQVPLALGVNPVRHVSHSTIEEH